MKRISGNPYLTKIEDKIIIDSLLIDDLLENIETPVMVFLENRIRDNIRSFNQIFNATFKNFECFYSFKANYLPEICKIINSERIGAELISISELNLALKLGFPPQKIIIGGPFLTNKIIKKSIINDIREIIVYNLKDLERINIIAQRFDKIQDVCLRVNSQKFNSKLGIVLNESNLMKLNKITNECQNIEITTILSHFTTQMNNIQQFNHNIKTIANNYQILREVGIHIEKLNLGGGFPEAVIMPENQLKKLAIFIKETLKSHDLINKKIYLEPGRYFVGDAGLFITEIVNIEDNRWIFLNIGNHICPKFAKSSLRFYNASKISKPHKYKTSIAGILPTDQDVLVKNYFFTEMLEEGDIVLVTNVGAYTLTFSNRFPYSLPKIYLVKDKSLKKLFDSLTDHDFSLI